MKTDRPTSSLRIRQRKGFTLIELVLVLAILAILMAAVLVNTGGVFSTANDRRLDGDMQSISTALILYQSKSGRLPTTEQGLDALINKPTKPPIPDRWVRCLDSDDLPKDPWNQPYHYRYPATKSKKQYDIWSFGEDGKENTEDDVGNWKKVEAAK